MSPDERRPARPTARPFVCVIAAAMAARRPAQPERSVVCWTVVAIGFHCSQVGKRALEGRRTAEFD